MHFGAKTTLGLFVKQPVAGEVKTRLAVELGAGRAAEIYAAFIVDLVNRFDRAADERFICFSPDTDAARGYFESLAGRAYGLWPQPEQALGGRMQRFFEDHLGAAGDRAVIIGSDSPTLPREYVERAFDELARAECVLGPANDGGYYLIGMRGRAAPVFSGIAWSATRVLDQTVARLEEAGVSLALLPAWYDVDTPHDLQVVVGHLRALALAGSDINVDATRRALGSA